MRLGIFVLFPDMHQVPTTVPVKNHKIKNTDSGLEPLLFSHSGGKTLEYITMLSNVKCEAINTLQLYSSRRC